MSDSAFAEPTLLASASAPVTRAPWWELTLQVPHATADDAGALLVDAGAMGVETFTPAAFLRRAWQQHASMGPGRPLDPSHEAAANGAYLVASFEGDMAREDVLALMRDALSGIVPATATDAAALTSRNDAAWAHAWREHFKPLKIGRTLWIVPRWETAFTPPYGSTVITIDPGMAFGTGQHATTSLCLKAIERRLAAAQRLATPVDVLDVGAGSGILAIAALLLGAPSATLIDIDELALSACRDNVAAAELTSRATISATWPAADRTFHLVVANILAGTLIEMMPELLSRLGQSGTLLVSGILVEQADAVTASVLRHAKAQRRVVAPVARLQHDKWVALAYGAPLDAPTRS